MDKKRKKSQQDDPVPPAKVKILTIDQVNEGRGLRAVTDSASPLDQPTLHCTIIMHKKSPGTCYWISLCKEVDLGGGGRPLSVPFLLLTSGKSQSQAGSTRRGAIFQISFGEALRPLLYVR